MRPDELLADLDASQRAAVAEPALPLAILAPAGSGKTRVLTRRIAWHVATERIEASHVLAVTFTRHAATELQQRLHRLGVREHVTAGTFHAVALGVLRRYAADRGVAMPALLDRKARVLGPLIGGARGAALTVAITEIAGEIEWAKARLVRPERYEAAAEATGRETPRPPAEVARIYQAYEREKRKKRLLDFDDLIWECAKALHNDPELAAVQRWRFRHLFVDEFQDATRAQLRLVREWLGDRSDLCVVGDPDQAIYAFAGADPALLERFGDRFAGATSVRLDTNYRSTPQVVHAARVVLPASQRALVRAACADGPEPTITTYADDEAEARGVAQRLRAAHRPERPWSELAILYRVNAQSAPFEEALRREGIPVRLRGAQAFLDRPEVRALLDALQVSASQAPGRAFTEHLTDLAEDARGGTDERREYAEALARLGHEYLASEGAPGSVSGFSEFLRATLRGSDDDGPRGDGVVLSTFHRAKGLEWDTVFVTGLERGLVPISHAEGDPPALAEERRLLYVAMSRAQRALHLSWAQQRARGARTSKRSRSPYLREVERVLRGERAAAPAASNGAQRARATLDAIGGSDLSPAALRLYDELVAWRSELARASSVPAYVILDNKALRHVAGTRPTSNEALLAVPGIGPVKLERYGPALLEVVGRHATAAHDEG
ncbi:MAG TPA: ATP-dependent DNA helicase UvrD2 [Acidimicrobiia bacterium]